MGSFNRRIQFLDRQRLKKIGGTRRQDFSNNAKTCEKAKIYENHQKRSVMLDYIQNNFQIRTMCSGQIARTNTQLFTALARMIEKVSGCQKTFSLKITDFQGF